MGASARPAARRRGGRSGISLAVWVALAPLVPTVSGCMTADIQDKRILQYLNREGFGKRYTGDSQEQNYVTIGDSITYIDTYHPDETRGTAVVDVDGTILMPDAGSVFVAGMTRAELESFLTQKLSPYWTETDVQVEIRTGGDRAFYVIGEVDVPGRKPFPGDVTLFEAVMQAEPSEYTANLGRVRLIRADPRNPMVIPVNVADMWRTGDSTYNLRLQEFDIVYVPPTLLKQFADVVSGVVVPLLTPFNAIIRAIFALDGRNRFGNGRNNRFFN